MRLSPLRSASNHRYRRPPLLELFAAAAALLAAATAALSPRQAQAADELRIPFTKTTLENGLVVVLSPDHSASRRRR